MGIIKRGDIVELDLAKELQFRGADFIYSIDISKLSARENRGYPNALLIVATLSPECIYSLSSDYAAAHDEFVKKEKMTDELAEYAADYLIERGYRAYAQSEKNNLRYGFYDDSIKTTPLPHKTIALQTGMGWIGKNALFVTKEYGSALSMCSVLTDAPLENQNKEPMESLCGKCDICKCVCPTQTIHGKEWKFCVEREDLLDVLNCECCLKCLVLCPWTQAYIKKIEKHK